MKDGISLTAILAAILMVSAAPFCSCRGLSCLCKHSNHQLISFLSVRKAPGRSQCQFLNMQSYFKHFVKGHHTSEHSKACMQRPIRSVHSTAGRSQVLHSRHSLRRPKPSKTTPPAQSRECLISLYSLLRIGWQMLHSTCKLEDGTADP